MSGIDKYLPGVCMVLLSSALKDARHFCLFNDFGPDIVNSETVQYKTTSDKQEVVFTGRGRPLTMTSFYPDQNH